ncbi:hypothetical protein KC19_11G098900 [Ceratodon purpureus]|uniref:TIR domain-containing protein n=1 Tax=Ceratodon purpureus TaxID=3225 RepID=A0A8T0GGY7_CERPU|nr:hypothetical protein KC19_11G098900 [Ceratodon purpureus]
MTESSTSTHRSAASGHSIFLSHSGAQKNFVEQLCVDLESCNRSVFFDTRSDSLPKGEPFPQHIFKAIQECQVGVVVLSEEFFSSKWPMLELVAMSKRMRLGNSRLKIMPIFLSLSPVECRDVTNHGRWLSTWLEWAQEDKRMDIEEWKEVVKLLGRMNGFVYKVGLGEVRFRKEIVKDICKVVLPTTTWDDSHVEGGSRLCKIICDKLNTMQACTQARVVGVYGVGGVGKTTLCKSLCKHFFREYEGKVCHVELKVGGNKLDLLRQVLRRLTNTSEKVLQGFSEDECYSLLTQSIIKQKVFIAIDNVFDSSKCLEEADAYLKLNYSPNSVVVVTARSLDQLQMLQIEKSNCLEMPDLEKDEARSLFMYHATHAGRVQDAPEVEVGEEIIKRCLKKCYFGKGREGKHHYHPLALEVLGRQLGYDPEPWKVQLVELDAGDAFNQLRERESQHPIFSILRRSFDMLGDEDQLLFMDAALFNPQFGTDVLKWLSLVNEMSVNVVKQRLMGLKRKSVIEEVGDGTTGIGMHDLWREFAMMETRIGDRERQRWVFDVMDNRSLRSDEEGDVVGLRFSGGWFNLQRICVGRTERAWDNMKAVRRQPVYDRDGIRSALQVFKSYLSLSPMRTGHLNRLNSAMDSSSISGDELDFRSCTNVTVLKLVRPMLEVLDLSALQNLRSLECRLGDGRTQNYSPPPGVEIRGLGGLKNLVILHLDDIAHRSLWIGEISGLTRLQVLMLNCETFWTSTEGRVRKRKNRYPDLGRLWSLQHLTILGFCNKAKSISGFSKRMRHLRILDLSYCSFSRCDGVGDLIALEELHFVSCRKLKVLPNLQRLTKLRKLDISGCRSIRALPGFGALTALETVYAGGCYKLVELPDLSNLIHLRTLTLEDSPIRTLPGLGNAVSLRSIRGIAFEAIEGCDDLHMLTELRTVPVRGWGSRGLSCLSTLPNLMELTIRFCRGMEVLTGLSNLTGLLRLTIFDCDFKDMSCVGGLSTLQELHINSCVELERLPDIHRLTRLESLEIWGCRRLRIWEGLRELSLLKIVDNRLRLRCEGSSALSMLSVVLRCDGLPITELPDKRSFPHFKSLNLVPQWNL